MKQDTGGLREETAYHSSAAEGERGWSLMQDVSNDVTMRNNAELNPC